MNAESHMPNRYADPRFDARARREPRPGGHAGAVYILMLVVALAFGGFVWQLYSAPAGEPRVTSPAAPMSPPAPSEPAEETISAQLEAERPPEPIVEATSTRGDLPDLVGDGPYVVQLAALQSEAGIEGAWRRIAARSPQLFTSARLDVERADLGQRGVYHRVRAGYFAERDQAALFCERLRRIGQDCIVVTR